MYIKTSKFANWNYNVTQQVSFIAVREIFPTEGTFCIWPRALPHSRPCRASPGRKRLALTVAGAAALLSKCPHRSGHARPLFWGRPSRALPDQEVTRRVCAN